jgi:integrase
MSTAKRRGAGEGTIRERVDGRWEGRYLGRDKDGNPALRSVYAKTKREAIAKLDVKRAAVRAGQPTPSERLTVGAYLTRWLVAAEPRLRPSTLRRYRQLVRLQLVPILGSIRLARLQPSDVAAMMADVQSRGLSARTAAHCRAVLRDALADAERDGLVSRNAARLAKGLRLPPPSPTVLSPEQVRNILDALHDPGLRRLAVVAITSGLRAGEQLGLRWDDIDFERRLLHVRTALQRVGGAYLLGTPKSLTSRRVVNLTGTALEALQAERHSQREARLVAGRRWREPIDGLVFTTATGAPRCGSSVTHSLQAALAVAGLPRLRWHDLRAAHGALLLAEGVDISVVSRRLGHSSVSLTSRFYGGVSDALDRATADRLERDLSTPS